MFGTIYAIHPTEDRHSLETRRDKVGGKTGHEHTRTKSVELASSTAKGSFIGASHEGAEDDPRINLNDLDAFISDLDLLMLVFSARHREHNNWSSP